MPSLEQRLAALERAGYATRPRVRVIHGAQADATAYATQAALAQEVSDLETSLAGKVATGGTLATVATAPPADGVIAALTFSAIPAQAECEALRDQCEILRDAVAALKTTVETLRVHS